MKRQKKKLSMRNIFQNLTHCLLLKQGPVYPPNQTLMVTRHTAVVRESNAANQCSDVTSSAQERLLCQLNLSTLKSELNRIRSSSKPSSTTVRNVSGLPTSMDDMAADANDSIVTVDEDIPELSDEEGLNSQAPTI